MNKKTIAIAAVAALAISAANAAEKLAFDFEDPKGVNNIVFLLDAPLESINGTANGISGTIQADPENPADVTGTIIVETATLHVPNPLMKEHLHGDAWLDIETHPKITFEIKEVSNVTRDGNSGTADVTGTFSVKGVSKDMTVPVRVNYLPGRLGERNQGAEGDLLVVRSDFTIKRSDFGIQAGQNEDKVADEIKVTLSLAGAAEKSN